jgi:GAF domain-containing protein
VPAAPATYRARMEPRLEPRLETLARALARPAVRRGARRCGRAPGAVPWALLVGALLSSGCADSPAGGAEVMESDSAGVTIVHNDLARLTATCPVDPEPNLVIGDAARGEEHELFRVFGATRLDDGRTALVNQGSQELRWYDRDGAFVAAAGRAGEGPGEFRNAFYLWRLPGDTVWVGDYAPWQYHLFDPDGEWVRSVRPRPEYANSPAVIQMLDDGRAVLAPRDFPAAAPGFRLRELTVVVHGPDGALSDTIGTYPNGRWGRVDDDPGSPFLYPLFEAFARVAAGGRTIVTGHGSEAELAVYDADTDLQAPRRIVRWTTESRAVSARDIEAERRRLEAQYEDLDPAMRAQLVAPLVSEDRPAADRFPAFRTLALGRDGRIWVREEPRPDAVDQQDWIAFSEEGRFECRARLPPMDRLLELGEDYLLVLHRDELGLERVLGYALDPPGGG